MVGHEHGEAFENISTCCVSPEVECPGIGQHYYMQFFGHCLIHLKAENHRNCLKLFARWPPFIWMIFRIFGLDPFQSASVEDSPTAPRHLFWSWAHQGLRFVDFVACGFIRSPSPWLEPMPMIGFHVQLFILEGWRDSKQFGPKVSSKSGEIWNVSWANEPEWQPCAESRCLLHLSWCLVQCFYGARCDGHVETPSMVPDFVLQQQYKYLLLIYYPLPICIYIYIAIYRLTHRVPVPSFIWM